MRVQSLFAVFLWSAGVAISAPGLELVVVTPGGAPLAGARVSVIGRSGSVVADGEGRCVLEPTPALPFVLFVARPDGVALAPVTVGELPPDGPLVVSVEAAGETVTVVSGKVPDLEVPPAVAATIIGRAGINQKRPQTLTDVVEDLPGVSRGGEGRSVVPGLRGMPRHRTLILLDDGRVTAERRAGPSASFLNPDTIDEVEVIRGPGSVAYGSDAFGGVIRARSRMPDPGASSTVVRYGLFHGTAAGDWGVAADVSGPALGGGLLVGAHSRRAGDYASPRGEVFDSGFNEYGFRLGWQAVLGNGVIHVGWRSDIARDVGKPSPDSRMERVSYPREDSHRFNVGFERPGPGSWTRLGVTLSLADYRIGLEKDRAATADAPRAVDRSETRARDYELRIEAERLIGRWRLVSGGNATGRFDLEATGTVLGHDAGGVLESAESQRAIGNARRDDLGLFVAVGRELGRWSLDLGLRGDRVTSESSGGHFGGCSSSTTDLSGFVAAGVVVGEGLELTAQVARGFRDPLLSERYYRGETGRGFITGNPDLDPETSRQLDLAIRWLRGPVQLAAYAYRYRIDDLIERYRNGGDYFYRNRASAEVEGVEIEGSVTLSQHLEARVAAQWLRGEVGDDGTPTDDVPTPGAVVVLRGKPCERWWWMVRGAVFARDDRPGPSEILVPGHGVLDAGVGWTLTNAVQLQVTVRNLFDTSYPGSADEDAVLAPGRGFMLSVRGRI